VNVAQRVILDVDEASIERLANVSDHGTVSMAVIIQLNALLLVVENVRRQVLHDIEVGHISIDE
jgi:hypothetical protein